ncbi:hypothetical protein F511_07298 [Dorcoceras hygrometricum]|uniref:Uncharacterized protein n=1 Tax=Dorcoceras hygrometricum TaxID=472368 RepID=A0A2Z7AU72_9LAMI|nr:hypothetical protein F511_07298 [Dorcoceras hygrometricum]
MDAIRKACVSIEEYISEQRLLSESEQISLESRSTDQIRAVQHTDQIGIQLGTARESPEDQHHATGSIYATRARECFSRALYRYQVPLEASLPPREFLPRSLSRRCTSFLSRALPDLGIGGASPDSPPAPSDLCLWLQVALALRLNYLATSIGAVCGKTLKEEDKTPPKRIRAQGLEDTSKVEGIFQDRKNRGDSFSNLTTAQIARRAATTVEQLLLGVINPTLVGIPSPTFVGTARRHESNSGLSMELAYKSTSGVSSLHLSEFYCVKLSRGSLFDDFHT